MRQFLHPNILSLVFGFSTLCLSPAPLLAATTPAAADKTIPEGFRDLAAPQVSYADYYYGGRYIASGTLVYTPDTVQISNPAEIVNRIRHISDPAAVIRALSGEVFSHPALVCQAPERHGCSAPSTEIAAVVFDPGRFRADLFIAEPYLQTRTTYQSKFLPESSSGLGLVQSLSATASGTSGTSNNRRNHSLFGNTLVGWKENHLVSEWDITRENDFSIDTLYAERDAKGLQYGAGFLSSNGILSPEFSQSNRLLGITVGTSNNSRQNSADINSTPLKIFTNGQRRIEVLRDNRLIYATSVEAGSQEINTQSFPGGSYNITIKVYDGTVLEQETTQLYTKSVRLPPSDEILWHLEGGKVTDRTKEKRLPERLSTSQVRGGIGFRIADNTALNLKASATSEDRTAESEVYYLGKGWDASGTVMVGNNNAKGLAFALSAPLGPVHLNYYHRRLWNDSFRPDRSKVSLLGKGFKTNTLSASTRFFGGSLSSSYSYTKKQGDDKQTIRSLRWFKTIGRFNGHDLDLQLNYSQSQTNKLVIAGLTLRRTTRSWNYSARSNSRWQKNNNGKKNQSNELLLNSRWYQNEILSGSGEMGLKYAHQSARKTLGGDIKYNNTRFNTDISANYVKPENSGSFISYTGRFETSFAMNANYVAIGGGTSSDSALLIDIEGSEDAHFDVLINGRRTGIASGNSTTVVPVSPYSIYRVSISPRGEDFFNYDQVEKEVILYPGNVETLTFKSEEELVLLGQLVDEYGDALASARIQSKRAFSRTDKYGIFQIRIPSSQPRLTVELVDNGTCSVAIPEGYQKRGGVGLVGTLECATGE